MSGQPLDVGISTDDADRLFAPLSPYQIVLVAVSGGPDSTALLLLLHDWAQRCPGVALQAASVDHGLRPQSGDEADHVAQLCHRLGIVHTTLRWKGDKPQTGVMAAARAARYRLLADHAKTFTAAHACDRVAILTAHTQDDQAETFVMRLTRGAGVRGLSAMGPRRALATTPSIDLVRPLLGVPKARLIATLKRYDVDVVCDPTNVDEKFERTRVRNVLASLADVGVTAAAIARSAVRCGDADDAVAWATRQLLVNARVRTTAGVVTSLDTETVRQAPVLLRQRALVVLMALHGGDSSAPDLDDVERLARRLDRLEPLQATLGGVRFDERGLQLRVGREQGRIDDRAKGISANARIVWDERFIISRSGPDDRDVRVLPLGALPLAARHHARAVRDRIEQLQIKAVPAWAVMSLPSFQVAGENVVAAPELLQPNGILFRFVTAGLELEAKSILRP